MEDFLSALDRLAQADPDRPALTSGPVRLTRAEFLERVRRLAALFAGLGVQEGSTVTIGLPNSIDFVETMFAAWALGAVPQPISNRLPPLERTAVVDLANPALAVGVPREEAGERPVLETLPEELPAGSFAPGVSPVWKIMSSGGSTGRPKLIAADAPAVLGTVAPAAIGWRFSQDGCVLVPGPLAHNGPFIVASVGMLLGNHVVVMPRFDAAETLDLVGRHRATWLYLVPTMMLRIWRLPEEVRAAADMSALQIVFHVAAPCPAWLKEAWIDWLGPERVMELYGGTEAQAATLISGTEWLAHRGSVGRPAMGEIEIRDDDGNLLPPLAVGEIWMRRGADVAPVYHYIGATGPNRPRRLGIAGRHRLLRRGRLSLPHRPYGRHDPGGGRQRLSGRDRGRPRRASGRAFELCHRPAGRGSWQRPACHRRAGRTGHRR